MGGLMIALSVAFVMAITLGDEPPKVICPPENEYVLAVVSPVAR